MRLLWLHDPAVVDDQSTAVLPDALRLCGWDVALGDTGRVRLAADGVTVAQSNGGGELAAATFDLCWLAGFGPQASFLDRMQLLAGVPGLGFVNAPQQLVMLHGKLALHGVAGIPQPETVADTDPAALWARVLAGGRWVAKPPGGSRGRDVFVLEGGDSNGPAILEHLTDGGRRHALLQRFVEAARDGELRVLVAAGEVVGAYRRQAAPGEHCNNLHRGGAASIAELTAGQQAVVADAATALQGLGVRWVGLDLAGEQVLEVNIAAPGGLGTLAGLGDGEAAARTAAAISRWWRAGPGAGC